MGLLIKPKQNYFDFYMKKPRRISAVHWINEHPQRVTTAIASYSNESHPASLDLKAKGARLGDGKKEEDRSKESGNFLFKIYYDKFEIFLNML